MKVNSIFSIYFFLTCPQTFRENVIKRNFTVLSEILKYSVLKGFDILFKWLLI